jgi:hypothetical protein
MHLRVGVSIGQGRRRAANTASACFIDDASFIIAQFRAGAPRENLSCKCDFFGRELATNPLGLLGCSSRGVYGRLDVGGCRPIPGHVRPIAGDRQGREDPLGDGK